MKNKTDASYILWILMLIMTVSVYFFLPDTIPLKWDFYGNIIKSGSKAFIFIFPVVANIGLLAKRIFPKIDPKHENYKSFEKPVSFIVFLIIMYLMIMEMIVIHSSFIPGSIDISVTIPVVTGALVTCMGNVMPQIRHNYFFGIRTPWTLENETVWLKTHRLGGVVWFICGILIMLTAFMPVYLRYIFFVFYIITAGTIPTVYSYIKYRNPGNQI